MTVFFLCLFVGFSAAAGSLRGGHGRGDQPGVLHRLQGARDQAAPPWSGRGPHSAVHVEGPI